MPTQGSVSTKQGGPRAAGLRRAAGEHSGVAFCGHWPTEFLSLLGSRGHPQTPTPAGFTGAPKHDALGLLLSPRPLSPGNRPCDLRLR